MSNDENKKLLVPPFTRKDLEEIANDYLEPIIKWKYKSNEVNNENDIIQNNIYDFWLTDQDFTNQYQGQIFVGIEILEIQSLLFTNSDVYIDETYFSQSNNMIPIKSKLSIYFNSGQSMEMYISSPNLDTTYLTIYYKVNLSQPIDIHIVGKLDDDLQLNDNNKDFLLPLFRYTNYNEIESIEGFRLKGTKE